MRELQNVIQRCMVLRESGAIQVEDLPASLKAAQDNSSAFVPDPKELTFQKAREVFEQSYLKKLLEVNEGNVTQPALLASISRRHLQELMKKYGLRPDGN